jgi:hypothetical protein
LYAWQFIGQFIGQFIRLNYLKMAAIADYAESVCRSAADAELHEYLEDHDPIDFEAKSWKRALGLFYKPVAMLLGVPNFKTRKHVSQAARALQSFGL